MATYVLRLPNGQCFGLNGVELNPPDAQTVDMEVAGWLGKQKIQVVMKYSKDDVSVPKEVLRQYSS